MWKVVVVSCLVTQILVCRVTSRAVEPMDSSEEATAEPVDIPIKIGPIRSPPKNFSIFNQVDDPFFSFMSKMANFGYLSSQVAISRMKDHSQKIKDIGGQVEGFIENLPTFPIPILDNMSHTRVLN
ncbi:uncharacterized protein LOC108908588 [Anoplophora glabripennis]|uniref:uncharacterized protein LOC108908588 n=1 Tax=Anoplophora glabripennis TaxID=217634 RepID=UPI00087460EA|nr:uncharacterized protein LOC108908588 [Anoplophora glabripennis]